MLVLVAAFCATLVGLVFGIGPAQESKIVGEGRQDVSAPTTVVSVLYNNITPVSLHFLPAAPTLEGSSTGATNEPLIWQTVPALPGPAADGSNQLKLYDAGSPLLPADLLPHNVATQGNSARNGNWHARIDADGGVRMWLETVTATTADSDGETAGQSTSAKIQNLPPISTLALGSGHAVALTQDGEVWAWEIAPGAYTNTTNTTTPSGQSGQPVKLAGLPEAVSIGAWREYGFAKSGDGAIWIWQGLENKYAALTDEELAASIGILAGNTPSQNNVQDSPASNLTPDASLPRTAEVTVRTPIKPLTIPAGLSAFAISWDKINLTWTAVPEESVSYELERRLTSGSDDTFAKVVDMPATTTHYTDTGLAGSTSYTYRLRTVLGTRTSDYGSTATAMTFAAPPSVPQDLSTSDVTDSSITLTWSGPADPSITYEIERREGVAGYIKIASVSGMLSHTDTLVVSGATYTYRIRARNNAGMSDYAASSSVIATSPTQIPAPPTNLAAYATGQTSVILTWTPSVTSDAVYELQRKDSSGAFTSIGPIGGVTSPYSDNSLAADTTYTYRLRSSYGLNYSTFTAEVSVTTDAAPLEKLLPRSGLSASPGHFGQINLSWDAIASSMELQRWDTSIGDFVAVAFIPAGLSAYVDGGLVPGASYEYRLRALGDYGEAYMQYTSAVRVSATGKVSTPHVPRINNRLTWSVSPWASDPVLLGHNLYIDDAPPVFIPSGQQGRHAWQSSVSIWDYFTQGEHRARITNVYAGGHESEKTQPVYISVPHPVGIDWENSGAYGFDIGSNTRTIQIHVNNRDANARTVPFQWMTYGDISSPYRQFTPVVLNSTIAFQDGEISGVISKTMNAVDTLYRTYVPFIFRHGDVLFSGERLKSNNRIVGSHEYKMAVYNLDGVTRTIKIPWLSTSCATEDAYLHQPFGLMETEVSFAANEYSRLVSLPMPGIMIEPRVYLRPLSSSEDGVHHYYTGLNRAYYYEQQQKGVPLCVPLFHGSWPSSYSDLPSEAMICEITDARGGVTQCCPEEQG